MTRGTLYVEGPDDEHAVRHLLARRGFESSLLPEFRATEGKDRMLAAMDAAIRAGTGTSMAFLLDVIPDDDPLMPHAEASTRAAVKLGAQFRAVHAPKAVLHAWLAWQRTPGLPYGTAIKAGFLGDAGDTADRFVGWCRRVFGLPARDSRV